MHKKRIFILFIAISVLLSACGDNNSKTPGFFLDTHVATGGKRIDNANLRNIDVRSGDGGASIIFTFVEGSALAGDSEAPTSHLPPYRVSMMTSPSRIYVSFQNVLYWDFVPYSDSDSDAVVSGIFRGGHSDSGEAHVYIQLGADAVYQTEENGNQLIIKLLPSAENVPANASETGFYIVLDAFDSYGSGNIPKDFNLHPALYNDYHTPTLISPPFAREQEASQQAMKLNDHLSRAMPGKEAIVQELKRNDAPRLDVGYSAEIPFALPNASAEILAQDAHFVTCGDESFIVAKPNLSGVPGEESESLWRLREGGEMRLLSDVHFATVGPGKLSGNGAYLAFTEEAESSSPLYLLDIEKSELTFLGGELGMYTESFEWGQNGLLYALTSGDEDSGSLKVYDPAELSRDEYLTGILAEEPIVESDIAVIGDSVYYSEDSQVIYRVNPEEGQRIKIAEGARFTASPDERYLAVAAYNDDIDEDAYSRLKTVNLSSGQEISVLSGRLIADYAWSSDSSLLYYLLYIDEEDNIADEPTLGDAETADGGERAVTGDEDAIISGMDDVFCELYVYNLSTGENIYVGQLGTAMIYPGTARNELIFSSGNQQAGRYVWTTYCLTIDTEAVE